ncbi:MAG TPA: hypothetical protein VF175_01070 [Lacipirellula sp.]
MDSAAPQIPSPSVAWSHLAASHGEPVLVDLARGSHEKPQRSSDEAAQLRARLLRMIVDSEQSRKAAAAEGINAR